MKAAWNSLFGFVPPGGWCVHSQHARGPAGHAGADRCASVDELLGQVPEHSAEGPVGGTAGAERDGAGAAPPRRPGRIAPPATPSASSAAAATTTSFRPSSTPSPAAATTTRPTRPTRPRPARGALQAFFEFQTLICQLTGMDVANASLYEGGSTVAEAVLMALNVHPTTA